MQIKPVIIRANDYHEFLSLQAMFDQIFGKNKVKVKEISSDKIENLFGEFPSDVYAIVYSGTFPSKSEVTNLIKDYYDNGLFW